MKPSVSGICLQLYARPQLCHLTVSLQVPDDKVTQHLQRAMCPNPGSQHGGKLQGPRVPSGETMGGHPLLHPVNIFRTSSVPDQINTVTIR